MNIRKIILLFYIGITIAILANVVLELQTVTAQIDTMNDEPSWINIDTIDLPDEIIINVSIRDLNGWEDIYNVTLKVLDANGTEKYVIIYSQYQDLNSTTMIIEWIETTGNYLIRSQCDWNPADVSPWNPDNAVTPVGLNISFVLTPFYGHSIQIIAVDRDLATCEFTSSFPFYSDNDDLPDDWELEYFHDLIQSANDDPDNDNYTNIQEYEANTDPTDPDEYPIYTNNEDNEIPGFGIGTILIATILAYAFITASRRQA